MKKQNKIRGQIMSLAGLFFIIVNALTYFIKGSDQFILGIIGLLFLIIGINISKKE